MTTKRPWNNIERPKSRDKKGGGQGSGVFRRGSVQGGGPVGIGKRPTDATWARIKKQAGIK